MQKGVPRCGGGLAVPGEAVRTPLVPAVALGGGRVARDESGRFTHLSGAHEWIGQSVVVRCCFFLLSKWADRPRTFRL